MQLTAHAYLVRGGPETIHAVEKMLQTGGIETRGNPDVFSRSYTSFSIDDARTLRERAALRAVGESGRIFIIAAPTIPPDAQNALLKTFEEPPAGARFFLVVQSPEMLLPTLRSRMQVLDVVGGVSEEVVPIQAFLRASSERRIEMLKPFLEKGEDDKRDLSATIDFLAGLERELSRKPREYAEGLHAIYRARKYITDRGALAKTLLEQTALLVPKVLS